jgi:hypothetical protein
MVCLPIETPGDCSGVYILALDARQPNQVAIAGESGALYQMAFYTWQALR